MSETESKKGEEPEVIYMQRGKRIKEETAINGGELGKSSPRSGQTEQERTVMRIKEEAAGDIDLLYPDPSNPLPGGVFLSPTSRSWSSPESSGESRSHVGIEERASRPGSSRIPGKDHRRYYHSHWRMEYLMDFNARCHSMICMVCGSSLATLKLSTIKRHIRQKHPYSLQWTPCEKEVIIGSWDAHLFVDAQSIAGASGEDSVADDSFSTPSSKKKRRRLPPVTKGAWRPFLGPEPPQPLPLDTCVLEQYMNESLQQWLRLEFLMDYDYQTNQLHCMTCATLLPSPNLTDMKSHILETHPTSIQFSSSQKSSIIEAWINRGKITEEEIEEEDDDDDDEEDEDLIRVGLEKSSPKHQNSDGFKTGLVKDVNEGSLNLIDVLKEAAQLKAGEVQILDEVEKTKNVQKLYDEKKKISEAQGLDEDKQKVIISQKLVEGNLKLIEAHRLEEKRLKQIEVKMLDGEKLKTIEAQRLAEEKLKMRKAQKLEEERLKLFKKAEEKKKMEDLKKLNETRQKAEQVQRLEETQKKNQSLIVETEEKMQSEPEKKQKILEAEKFPTLQVQQIDAKGRAMMNIGLPVIKVEAPQPILITQLSVIPETSIQPLPTPSASISSSSLCESPKSWRVIAPRNSISTDSKTINQANLSPNAVCWPSGVDPVLWEVSLWRGNNVPLTHSNIYQMHWRTDYLMDYNGLRGCLVCMFCCSAMTVLKVSSIKRHILQKHPHTAQLTSEEKEAVIREWEKKVAETMKMVADQVSEGGAITAAPSASEPVEVSFVEEINQKEEPQEQQEESNSWKSVAPECKGASWEYTFGRLDRQGKDRTQHDRWNLEYLMDFTPKKDGLICMICGTTLLNPKITTVKMHIQQKHPDTTYLSDQEKAVVIEEWEQKTAAIQARAIQQDAEETEICIEINGE
ncbi:zinc finger translocation-associated protein [Bombina bombina]|uniref:zinc finger translocation-associated protein n=1 Tax=Bombina bombina TaxID=8345 RepID=UPI00235A505A|nr:zinc finger translocation-associated protein [Bombina bombina]